MFCLPTLSFTQDALVMMTSLSNCGLPTSGKVYGRSTSSRRARRPVLAPSFSPVTRGRHQISLRELFDNEHNQVARDYPPCCGEVRPVTPFLASCCPPGGRRKGLLRRGLLPYARDRLRPRAEQKGIGRVQGTLSIVPHLKRTPQTYL